jgi:hypothetical protein
MKGIFEGFGAAGAYLLSLFAFVSGKAEWLGVFSGIAGIILTLSMSLEHYANYRTKLAEAKAAERKLNEQEREAFDSKHDYDAEQKETN